MHIRAIRGSFRRRVWHPCHTHAALRIPSIEPTLSLLAQVLPRISQMYTEASGGEEPPTDAHRWLGCVGFSHGIHRIHRSFWRRRASHRFHRCTQMVRLRRVLWEDSLVAAWVWQGSHTLLICAHLCNLWEDILRQKLLCVP